MKTIHKIIIGIIVIAAIVGVIYLLRNVPGGKQLWVILSSVYGGVMIILGKIRGIFFRSDATIESLEDRLETSKNIERELIEVLMAERQVYKDKMSRLEGDYDKIAGDIRRQESVVESFRDPETWQEDVFEKLTDEEQIEIMEESYGKIRTSEDYRFDFN